MNGHPLVLLAHHNASWKNITLPSVVIAHIRWYHLLAICRPSPVHPGLGRSPRWTPCNYENSCTYTKIDNSQFLLTCTLVRDVLRPFSIKWTNVTYGSNPPLDLVGMHWPIALSPTDEIDHILRSPSFEIWLQIYVFFGTTSAIDKSLDASRSFAS